MVYYNAENKSVFSYIASFGESGLWQFWPLTPIEASRWHNLELFMS